MAGPAAKKATTPAKMSSGTKNSSTKKNTSILSFFQKTDTPPGASSRQPRITHFGNPASRSPSSGRGTPITKRGIASANDASGDLFLEDKKGLAKLHAATEGRTKSRSPTPDIWGDDEELVKAEDDRGTGSGSAAKRRKVDTQSTTTVEDEKPGTEPVSSKPLAPAKAQKRSGPFIDDSDSEDDMEGFQDNQETAPATNPLASTKARKQSGPFIDESDGDDDMEAFQGIEETAPTTTNVTADESSPSDDTVGAKNPPESIPPPLVRAATSNADIEEYANFDDLEEEDELIAEELRNRPWEAEEQDQYIDMDIDPDKDGNDCSGVEDPVGEEVSTCPICQRALKGLNETVSLQYDLTACLNAYVQPRRLLSTSMTVWMERSARPRPHQHQRPTQPRRPFRCPKIPTRGLHAPTELPLLDLRNGIHTRNPSPMENLHFPK